MFLLIALLIKTNIFFSTIPLRTVYIIPLEEQRARPDNDKAQTNYNNGNRIVFAALSYYLIDHLLTWYFRYYLTLQRR